MAIVLECSQGKCRRFVEIWFTFPGKNSENGGKINIFEGKVPHIRGKTVHFPPSGRTVTDNEITGDRTDGLDVFATANDFTDGARCRRLPGRRI